MSEKIKTANRETIKEICLLAFEGAKYLLNSDVNKLDNLNIVVNLDDYCSNYIDDGEYTKFIQKYNEDLDADIWISENIDEIKKLSDNLAKVIKKHRDGK